MYLCFPTMYNFFSRRSIHEIIKLMRNFKKNLIITYLFVSHLHIGSYSIASSDGGAVHINAASSLCVFISSAAARAAPHAALTLYARACIRASFNIQHYQQINISQAAQRTFLWFFSAAYSRRCALFKQSKFSISIHICGGRTTHIISVCESLVLQQ